MIVALRDALRAADVGVKCAIVHGSRTTGWAQPDSDTDLLVFSAQPEQRGDAWLADLLAPVAEQWGATIDAMHISIDSVDDRRAELETIEGAWPLFRFAAVHGMPVLGSLDDVLSAGTIEQLRRPISPALAAQLYAAGQLAGGASYLSMIGSSARSEQRLRRAFRSMKRSAAEVDEAIASETEDARMAALKISQAIHTARAGHKHRGDADEVVRGAAKQLGMPAEPLVEIVALGGDIDARRLGTWKRRLVRFLTAATDSLAAQTSLPADEWPALFVPYPPTLPLPSSARLDRTRRFSPDEFLQIAAVSAESRYEQTWTTLEGGQLSSWHFTFRRGSAPIEADIIAEHEPTAGAAFAALFVGDSSRARTSAALKHLLGVPALGVATIHVDFTKADVLPHAAEAWIPW